MASAQLFHLLDDPPVADSPDAGTIISANTPDVGRLTTSLLDPALPPANAQQRELDLRLESTPGPSLVIHGRWITRVLPAQVIGAGNWSFYAAQRVVTDASVWIADWHWGLCIAQWRQGTGVVARFCDTLPSSSGVNVAPLGQQADIASLTTVAGGALTLLDGDQIILEVWSQQETNASFGQLTELSILTNGLGQYLSGRYGYQVLVDTDAYLEAPQGIVYQ